MRVVSKLVSFQQPSFCAEPRTSAFFGGTHKIPNLTIVVNEFESYNLIDVCLSFNVKWFVSASATIVTA